MRICSFLPSGTEIVYALGLGESLRAVSHECDFPPEACDKPKVVRSKIDADGLSSGEIDRLVSDLYERGERIYEVDERVLRAAAPDIVITQELCEVCAVSYEDVRHAAARLDAPPQVVSLDPASIADVLADIRRLGALCGARDAADALAGRLQARVDAAIARAADVVQQTGYKPRVACIEWLDPLIAAGHWLPEMVEMAGGTDALALPGAPSRRIDMAELAAAAPDVLILMPCGMGTERAIAEATALGLGSSAEWRALPAVANGRVYAADASAYFSRSGPRLVDALELLGQMIHPDAFGEPSDAAAAVRVGW